MGVIFEVERPERRKRIPGYGGRYEVGDLGRVYSDGFEMSLIDGKYVHLCHDGVASRVSVAYLVARAFLPNLEMRPYVLHKDGNGKNNRVENLEWSERRDARWVRRPVLAYRADGTLVGRFDSIGEAAERLGVSRSSVSICARGKVEKVGEWIFRYI